MNRWMEAIYSQEPQHPMKKAIYVVIGLLLIGYAVFTTARISQLQAHLNELEISNTDLQAFRNNLVAALVQDLSKRADEPGKGMSSAKLEAIHGYLRLLPVKQVLIPPSGSRVNGIPSWERIESALSR
jgi:hypothetical protein